MSVVDMDPRAAMMRQAQEAQRKQETMQIASICTQIVVNRDKLCGEAGSAKSASIAEAAERILLSWFNGLTEEK